ncbi:unnamed protein product, partial [Phaeothamnion confervicola]
DGRNVTRVDLHCPAARISASFISYGATLISVRVPDQHGAEEEITLQYFDLAAVAAGSYYYGSTIGRVANRIAGGRFVLDGATFQLPVNNGPNSLHGGVRGFDQAVWRHELLPPSSAAAKAAALADGEAGVRFSLKSPDGDQGYPGAVAAEAVYSLGADGALNSCFRATVDGRATVVNITNHAYWNLSGGCRRPVTGHTLRLHCSRYLPVDASQIPTGEMAAVAGTLFDFCAAARPLSDVVRDVDGGGRPGLDHCFVVDGHYSAAGGCGATGSASAADRLPLPPAPTPPPPRPLMLVAEVVDPESGRTLSLSATQPGVQVYTANWLSADAKDAPHTAHNGVCLETQAFPDAANRPEWAPSVVLRPGCVYEHRACHRFGLLPL